MDGVNKRLLVKPFQNQIKPLKMDMVKDLIKNAPFVTMYSILFVEIMVLLTQIFVNFENVEELMWPT